MEHDKHQNKVLAVGIALLISAALIVFVMHDADANPDAGGLLRVRDALSTENTSRAESHATSLSAEGKRGQLQDHR